MVSPRDIFYDELPETAQDDSSRQNARKKEDDRSTSGHPVSIVERKPKLVIAAILALQKLLSAEVCFKACFFSCSALIVFFEPLQLFTYFYVTVPRIFVQWMVLSWEHEELMWNAQTL